MAVKYLKPGQEFDGSHFSKDFGFTGSAAGRHDPQAHTVKNTEYGDGLAKGGRPRFQDGGAQPRTPRQARPVQEPPVPATLAKRAAMGALRLGMRMGAHAVKAGLTGPQATPPALAPTVPTLPASGAINPATPGAPVGTTLQAPVGAKKGGPFRGIKRPGRLKNLAKRHGVSLGQEIAKDVHSKNPSLRSAAVLGRRIRSGDLRSGKRK
jgi:hypothetical protein